YSMVMVTPGIFFVIVAAFTFSFKFFGPKRTREIGWALTVLMFLLVLQFLRMSKVFWMIPLSAIVYIIYKLYSRLDFMKDSWAWLPHIFEAWVTSFGVFFGLIEEQVLAGAIMQGNPFAFGIVKTLLIPVIMYLIKDTEKVQKIYIGSVIGALGLGPGIRDLLELLSL
ncbi:MAG: DUF63 family protein, partial [Candidatus Altiarchaeota archaeon]|nr:DUF63 family protein [Candidatus Altiarchaeota archaeon]